MTPVELRLTWMRSYGLSEAEIAAACELDPPTDADQERRQLKAIEEIQSMKTNAPLGRKVAARELQRLDGILDELQRHVAQGGALDDPCVISLYQDYFGLRRGEPVNGPAVRTWAARHANPPAAATSHAADSADGPRKI
jgi:hypothetical protein